MIGAIKVILKILTELKFIDLKVGNKSKELRGI
jgi:hypothetical protein